ncbi:MAG: hypothetical protein L0211_03150 [Planctomycetaceae bacterium]|nr:hypothetical protein [Planctomycetaceae bacterium]
MAIRLALAVMGIGFTAQAALAQAAAQPAAAPLIEFAPGVLTTIEPAPQNEEMFSGPRPLVEVPIAIEGLEYDPKLNPKAATVFERSKSITLRRTIWNLELSFKPLRMIYVDIPQPSGKMQRKLVWYMVYRVRNMGNHIKPKPIVETVERTSASEPNLVHTTYEAEKTNEVELFGQLTSSLRFFPHFVLASSEYDKEYLDRVIPAALEPIRQREFPGREVDLRNSLTISGVALPVSDPASNVDHSAWGVVTWVDVDPRIDYYKVFVQGLTNAYQFEDGEFKKGDAPGSGRKFTKKTLQLNFWRPGDTVDPHEEEIRYGCRIDADPAEQQAIFAEYGVDKPIDHLWVYR